MHAKHWSLAASHLFFNNVVHTCFCHWWPCPCCRHPRLAGHVGVHHGIHQSRWKPPLKSQETMASHQGSRRTTRDTDAFGASVQGCSMAEGCQRMTKYAKGKRGIGKFRRFQEVWGRRTVWTFVVSQIPPSCTCLVSWLSPPKPGETEALYPIDEANLSSINERYALTKSSTAAGNLNSWVRISAFLFCHQAPGHVLLGICMSACPVQNA